MNAAGVFLALFLLLPSVVSAQTANKLTMLEGSVRLIRGTTVYKGLEGVQLRQGDMLETSEGGFAQLEFPGGTVVALGPSSKVYLYRLASGRPLARGSQGVAGHLIVLSGWLKGESAPEGGMYRYSTTAFTLSTGNGAVIIHLDPDGCDATIEAGSAVVGESSESSRQNVTVKAFQFLSKRTSKNLVTAPRPSASFVSAMPQAFKDTLPPRLAHFQDQKPVEPKADHAVTFSDLQPWLTLPTAWRQGFVERFTPCLKDAEFRRGIEAHLAQYPEWDPILHPERYKQQDKQPSTQQSEKSPTR